MTDAKVFKAWQREWALIRREFLAGKLPVPVVAQVSSSESDGYRWECPESGAVGRLLYVQRLERSRWEMVTSKPIRRKKT